MFPTGTPYNRDHGGWHEFLIAPVATVMLRVDEALDVLAAAPTEET
ncbi:hypothetical protein [Micromonospora sp. KC723]|nr:hypothetical protein [Micromonospora sp. KC723]